MREYSRTRAKNEHEAELRRQQIFDACPELKDMLKQIQADSALLTRLTLHGQVDEAAAVKGKVEKQRGLRDKLLQEHGFSMADFQPRYKCPDCKDTGYIGREKCHCFKQAATDLLYEQSRIKTVLEKENFDNFSLDWFSSKPMDSLHGKSNREYMAGILAECREYSRTFNSGSKSILFTGPTGVGKTFLSNCIAKAVLEKGNNVLYLSAIEFFDLLAHQVFDDPENGFKEQSELLSSDLLIVDDLGTEVTNTFTLSRLFHCINSRLIHGRPMIISTNLTLNDLNRVYSERITSRVFSAYKIYALYGEDIRIAQKFAVRRTK